MRCKSEGKISRQNFPGSIVDTRVATMWTRPRPHIRLRTRPRASVRHARVRFLRAARPQMWPGSRPHSGHGRVHILVTAGSTFWSRAGPDFGRGRVQILSRPGPDSDRGRVQILRAARSKMWPGSRPFWTRKDSLSGHARQKIWRKKVLRRTETTTHPGGKLLSASGPLVIPAWGRFSVGASRPRKGDDPSGSRSS